MPPIPRILPVILAAILGSYVANRDVSNNNLENGSKRCDLKTTKRDFRRIARLAFVLVAANPIHGPQ